MDSLTVHVDLLGAEICIMDTGNTECSQCKKDNVVNHSLKIEGSIHPIKQSTGSR